MLIKRNSKGQFIKGSSPPKVAFRKGQIPWNKGKRTKKVCLHCGKEFTGDGHQGIKRRKFCSNKCTGLYHALQTKERMLGRNNWAWKGGSYVVKSKGYRRLTISVLSLEDQELAKQMTTQGNKGSIWEHRLVMARKLGRPLSSDEIVHHIDGNKLNNHPDNLELLMFDNRNARYPIICLKCGHQF